MDMLMDYFSIVEERMDFTAAFRLERAIPRRVLKKVADYRYTFNQQLAAMKRFRKRLGPEGWPISMLECALVAATPGKKQLPLPTFTDEQRNDPIFPGNAQFLKDYCGIVI
jgi:hypothetical protein